jgi:hypothetical protein
VNCRELTERILYSLTGIGIVGWRLRRWVRPDLAPRRRRLELAPVDLAAVVDAAVDVVRPAAQARSIATVFIAVSELRRASPAPVL